MSCEEEIAAVSDYRRIELLKKWNYHRMELS
jgi:hypothetical protein